LIDGSSKIRHDLGQGNVDDGVIQDSHKAPEDNHHEDAPFMIFVLQGKRIQVFFS
jgi:hypothetical protein